MVSIIKRMGAAGVFLSVLVGVGMPAAAQTPTASLGVNDVSVLFPRPRNAGDLDAMLRLDVRTAGGQSRVLLPRNVFDDVVSLGQGGPTSGASFRGARRYEDFRIVGFRFDPCFGFPIVSRSECRSELRLVAQPIEVSGGRLIVHDFALHLIYRPEASNRRIAERLVALKQASPLATGSFALGEHPGLFRDREKPVNQRAYSAQVKALITELMHDGNLVETAFVGSNDGVSAWNFWVADVDAGNVRPRGIFAGERFVASHPGYEPVLGGVQAFDATLRALNDPFIANQTTVPVFAKLARDGRVAGRGLRELVEVARRIENPLRHFQGSTDCVSCHTATTSRFALQERMMSADATLRQNPERFDDPALFGEVFPAPEGQDIGRDDTLNNTPALTNLRMFGYFHNTVSVSQRTINESASVADFIRRFVLTDAADDVFCPDGGFFDTERRLCVVRENGQLHAVGPFTEQMTLRCERFGGGPACRNESPVAINGRPFVVQRWNLDFATRLRGDGACLAGATQAPDLGGFCTERFENERGVLIEHAYGPFGAELVERCQRAGGGSACFFNRWNAAFLRSLLRR